jgi:glycosyltransferase involved in cell wall biosynthesis
MPERFRVKIKRGEMSGSGTDRKMPRISVVIPALNEEQVVGRAVAAIPRSVVHEVIVVDNGSTDRTSDEARRAGAKVLMEPARGYGNACLAGTQAVSSDCDIIVLMDADLSDDPSQIPLLIAPIVEEEYDLVLGSRLLGAREKGSLTGAQILGSRLVSLMIRALYGVRYTDMGPFRAIKRAALQSLNMHQRTYGWSIEMQVKAAARRLRIREVPVNWRNRAAGESKVAGTLKGSVRAATRIIYTVLQVAIGELRN